MKKRTLNSLMIYLLIFLTVSASILPTPILTAYANTTPDITLSNSSFPENSSSNLTIGTLAVAGGGWGATTPTFTLVAGTGDDDNPNFRINGSSFQTRVMGWDFESQSTFSVRVRATTSLQTLEKVFTISLTNVNEAPSIPFIPNQVLTEDQFLDIPVSWDDPEGTMPIISVTGGSAATVSASMLNATTIRLTPAANYFTSTPISFSAIATDGLQSSLGSFSGFSLTVTAVNDVPIANNTNLTVTEDTPVNATLSASDVESDTLLYSILTQPTRGTVSITNTATGAYTYTPAANQFGTDTFTFRVAETLTTEKHTSNTATVSVTIGGVNDTPTDISLSNSSLPENNAVGATIGDLSSTDVDSSTFTYSLVAGTGSTDNGFFSISGNQLRAASSFNFETKNNYSVRIRTADDGALFFEKAFTISVTNVNESPTNLTLTAQSINENNAVGATIGTFTTTDPDAGSTFAYALITGTGSTDNGSFTVSGSGLTANQAFDFETKSSYSIRARTTDQGGLTFEQTFTITVNNVNEAPTNISLNPNSITENNAVNSTIGTLSTVDPDASNTFTYTLVTGTGSTDNSLFSVTGSSLLATASLDFEASSTRSIRVRSTDQGGLFFEQALTVSVLNSNEAPTDISLSSTSIAENNAANATVGTFTTTDSDPGNTHTYSFVTGTGSTDNASFSITGATLSVNNSLNFETKTSYSIRVRTTDQGGLTFDKAFTITVTNVNESPTAIAMNTTSIAENNTAGATVGTLTTTDPDAGSTFTYTLVTGTGSTDNASFTITGSTVTVNSSLDFESKNSYSIRVRSTDQGGLTTETTFTITVTNVNEAPTNLNLSATTINENNTAGATIGTLSSVDPDAGNTFTYSLVTGTGSTDNASFTVAGSNLNVNSSLNFEAKSSYSIRLRTTDQGGLTFDRTFNITVNDLNEAPTAITLSSTTIAENNAANATVGTFTSTDQDAGNTHTYTLVTGTGSTDNASFTITGNTLTVNSSLNFETKNSYLIRVRSTDQGGLTFEQAITITVTNVNETPTAIALSNTAINENNASGATVGSFTTTDPDAGNTFTYTLVAGDGSADNATFSIVGANLNAGAVFNFETKNSYSIRVRSTDQGGLSFERTFTITVNDVNETPLTLTLSNNTIAENNLTGANIGTLSSTDPDASNTFTYTLVTGTGSTDNTSFTITGNSLNAAASYNFETKNSFSIRVRTTDQGGLFLEQTFTINVTNVNEAPTALTLSATSINENNAAGATVGTLTTTDQDAGSTFTYSLVTGTGSTDNASFTVTGSTLTVNSSLDFETKNSYAIRIRTTDQGGLTFEQTFTITVVNVNENPTDLNIAPTAINENNAVGATIGTITTTDPDAGNTFTYTLVTGTGSTDNGSFAIVSSSLNAAIAFNFETKSTYSIRVRTTDQGSLTFEKAFTISVNDLNEAPSALALSNTTIAENNAANATIGTFTTTDQDAANTHTYILVTGTGSTDNASFTITGNTLTVNSSLNFETKNSYAIRVRTTDQGGLTFEQTFTISVTNVNEAPTAITLSATSIAENNAANATVGTLSTTDQDAGSTFTYALVAGTGSTDNASFTITGSTLTVNSSLDFETKNSYAIRVRTTDQGGLTFEQTFTITVTNVNETPTALTLTPNSINENNAAGATVGQFATTDVDAGSTFTYTLVTGTGSTDNASFTIAGASLNANASLNFETKNSYAIRVRTTDQGGLFLEQTFTVTVNNLNEAPTALLLSNTSIAENNAANATIGTFTTTDQDAGSTHTYTFVTGTGSTDNASFTITGNTLTVNSSLDFETKTSYAIRVRTTDQGGLTFEQTFTITVTNVNETPTALNISSTSINENNTTGATVGSFTTTDPDAGNTFTYTLVTGEGSTDNASFSIAGANLNAGSSFNFENKSSYAIRVRTTDQGGLTFERSFTITVNDVNEAPTALALSNTSLAENNAVNATVGTFTTTDQDAANTHTYTLVTGTGSADNASFAITGNTLTVNSSLNFETKNSYAIRVRTTDQGGLTFEQTFTISVTNVNEAPTAIALSATSIAENNAANATIGTLSTTDPDAANTFTYSFVTGTGSTDNGAFTITGNTLTVNSVLDFESKNSYAIRVRTTDQGGLTFEQTFTISVTNVNEAPTALALNPTSINENNTAGATVGTLSTTDQDAGSTFTYTLVTGTGSTDNTSFTITGATLSVNSALNFETKNSYAIRVRTTDQGGLFFEQAFTVTVNDLNEAPTALALSNNTLAENNAAGATIGTLSTTDQDAANTFTYTLVTGTGSTDNAAFTITGNTLTVNNSLDFESKTSYAIRVRTTDQGGLTFEQTFTITVTNVNETPTALNISSTSINENNAAGATVGAFSTTDPDAGNTFTYTLVTGTGSTDNASFSVTGANLTAVSSFNFETKNSFSIRVRTTDQGGLTFERQFTITVNDVNEAPTALALSNTSIAENNAANATIGTFTTTDQDAANTFTYSLVAGTGSTDNASFTITGNTLSVNSSLNFETKNSYAIRVRTTDQGALSFEQTFTVTVTDVNEAPTAIALSATSIAENNVANATIGTLTTTDQDAANTFTYTLVTGTGSTDNGAFSITGNTLTVNSSLNFETKNSYAIRVRTTDQGGLTFEQTFTITVTNVNETPTALTLTPTAINENNLAGATVGTLTTTDQDAGSTFTYTLVTGTGSTDNASFTIAGSSLNVNAALNFEVKNSYAIRVRTTDQGGLFFEQTFTVTVNDLNEAPTALALSNNTIAENNAAGATIGTLSTTDQDAANTFTYTLVTGTGSTDNASFTITGNSLTVNNSLDFEAKTSYAIRVRTTDQGSLTFDQTFTITVTNVNETPTAINISSTSINENNVTGATVGALTTTDPDAGNTFTYTLVTGTGSTDNASFAISGANVNAVDSFNFETKNSYSIRVRTTDQGGLTFERTFTITVNDVNEAPTALTISNTSIVENNAVNATIGTFSTTDQDAGSTFTYSLVTGTGSTDNASFTINGNSLRVSSSLNFEVKNSYEIRVRTTDQGGLTFEQPFTITVTDVNEAPTALALSATSIAENNAANATIGTLSTTDQDAGSTFTYSLVTGTGSTDNGAFTLTGNTITVNSSLNFEVKNSYLIRVRTTDQGGLTFEQPITITVTNVNEAPTNILLSNDSLFENSGPNGVVGNLSAVDVDAGSTYTFNLVNGQGSTHNSSFNISGNALRATASLNFEAIPTMSVRVQLVDGEFTFEKAFTINVININEAPTDITLTPSSIDENKGSNAVVGELAHNTLDGDNTFSFSLVAGTGSTDNDKFTISGKNLLAKNSLNFEEKNTYSVRVRVANQEFAFVKVLTVTVNDLNDLPSDISLNQSMVDENEPIGTLVGILQAEDEDAISQVEFSLVPGIGDEDNEHFSIEGNQLLTESIFDFETKNVYSIRVQVSDNGLTFESVVIIEVNDVNEAPTNISLSNLSIEEIRPINTVVGELTAEDPDEPSTFTFTLVRGEGSTDNMSFNILNDKLRTSSIFDYETKNSYSVRIQVSDGSFTFEKVFAITIVNGNEPPTTLTLSNNRVDEKVWLGFLIGEFAASDPDDAEETLKYSLVVGEGSEDNSNYIIDGKHLKTNVSLSYDKPVQFVRVRVTDPSGLYLEQAFQIQVTQANAILEKGKLIKGVAIDQITIFFKENLLASMNKEALKNAIHITNEANVVNPEYDTFLTAEDTLNIRGNKIVLQVRSPITTQYNRLKILGGILRDQGGNLFPNDQFTSPLLIDVAGPKYIEARFVDKRNKRLVLTFNEIIAYGSNAPKNPEKELDFRSKVRISFNASSATPTYSALGEKDRISFDKRNLVINFSKSITTSDTRIQIDAGALVDRSKNLNESIETPIIELDKVGPVLKKVTLGKDNKTISIQFNEEIKNNLPGTRKVALPALRNTIYLSKNANSPIPTYNKLTELDVVVVSGSTLTVILATPLTGDQNRIQLTEDTVRDIFGNTNDGAITSILVADEEGPKLVSASLPAKGKNKVLEVVLNEEVFNALEVDKKEVLNAFRLNVFFSVSDSPDDETATFAPIAADVTTNGAKGKSIIKFNFKDKTPSMPARNKYYRIKILANTIKDTTGNKNLEIISDAYTVDNIGPALR